MSWIDPWKRATKEEYQAYPVGTRVCLQRQDHSDNVMVDSRVLPVGATGVVISNRLTYLGISVEFDTLIWETGEEFVHGFDPEHLTIIETAPTLPGLGRDSLMALSLESEAE